MTVIAYKDGVLAVDTMSTSGSLIHSVKRKKCVATDKYLAAVTGECALGDHFLEWVKKGMPEPVPNVFREDKTSRICGIIIDRNSIIKEMWSDGLFTSMGKQNIYANGDGREVALGAMYAGATAEEALSITKKLITSCGGTTRTISFKKGGVV